PLYSTKEIREVDDYAIRELNIPAILLMENASLQVYNLTLSKYFPPINKVGFLCGKGNNGGDGFAAARHFYNNGYEVTVIYLSGENDLSGDSLTNFKIINSISKVDGLVKLKKYKSTADLKILQTCNIIFDALLGSGAEGELREPYLSIIKKINDFNCYKVAIDIPTGLNANTGYTKEAFKGDLTITLGEFKKGLFVGASPEYTGEVVKGSIGIHQNLYDKCEPASYLIEPEDAFFSLPKKGKTIHKYSAGKVLTIAGSGSYPGAAALTSEAVLRAGAGASVLAFPSSVKNIIHSKVVEVVVDAYDDKGSEQLSEHNIEEIEERIDWADVVAIGPGLGRENSTMNAVIEILKSRTNKKMVIDADGLFALSRGKYKELDLSGLILTPHHGEFARLLDIPTTELQKDILTYGKNFAEETGSYLVLKGAPTIIFTPDGDALINTVGNAGLAKFGTGDVLTGIIAGLLAQHYDVEQSVVAGVYLHSLTADIIANDFTEYSYTAEDILLNLHRGFQFLRKSFA
ncbi:MAG: NAD(P)H-hydrate dehydratase, partial [Ignavibacteriaceae bacterium]|nr:NAD(P)H-hydrate dehydratase [Ignavibacteriaceae bacterium]